MGLEGVAEGAHGEEERVAIAVFEEEAEASFAALATPSVPLDAKRAPRGHGGERCQRKGLK